MYSRERLFDIRMLELKMAKLEGELYNMRNFGILPDHLKEGKEVVE